MNISGVINFNGAGINIAKPPCIPTPPIMGNVSYSTINTGNANTFANVSFTPQYDGGAGIINYRVTSNTGISTTSTTNLIQVTGLTKGSSYTFTATATNGQGTSANSNVSAIIVPVTVPGTPTIGTASVFDASTVLVSFTATSCNGGSVITCYISTSSPGNVTSTVSQANAGNVIVSGLTPGTTYTFTVSANNIAGFGVASTATNTVTPAGYLLTWGGGQYGSTGLGNNTNYSSPKQVGALNNWKQISMGGVHGTAIKTDGSLWTWGNNGQGQLGLGNTLNYSSPKQVGALTNWALIVPGFANSQMNTSIKSNGTMWSWGYNWCGQLGIGTNSGCGKSSPAQIGTDSNWSTVSSSYSSLAIRTDKTLWSWGCNSYGQLGLGNITKYSSPKQVGALTNWATVSVGAYYSTAVKTDGTLWAWGKNNYGQLGICFSNNYSSPKQVGSCTNWKSVYNSTCSTIALKTDGTLWGWGHNQYGELGLGNVTMYRSPKQIGALTNWAKVGVGDFNTTFGITNNGKLYAWGYNGSPSAPLGLGNTTSYSSPVQVGSLTYWTSIASGGPATIATHY
jgi:alpha-tubulin suppressor-like RCC1 family protein